MSGPVRVPLLVALLGLAPGTPAFAQDYAEQLRTRLEGREFGTAGRIDVVLTGGQLSTPEFRMSITPQGDGQSRVDIVDLHESLWAATARFEDAPPGNEYEAWTNVRRTEFDVKTAACPALAPAIAAFVTTVESRLATFKAEPARAPHDQITSHARLVEVRATDANFVQMTLGSLSGGLDGLLVAADKITRAASACSGLPVRRLAPTAQDD